MPTRPRLAAALLIAAALITVSLLSACARLQRFLPPSPTPTASATPTLTPSPTPTITPSPTPTLVPAARIEQADTAVLAGDWPAALAAFASARDLSPDPGLRAAAQLGLGRTHLLAGEYAGAIAELRAFVEQYPDSPQAADASFLLGEAYRFAGEPEAAVEAYRFYLALRPWVIDSYLHERLALALEAAGDVPAALEAYQAAAAAPRAEKSESLDLRESALRLQIGLGQVEAALAQCDGIYADADEAWRRARLLVQCGDLLYAQGRADEAYARYQQAVDNYPETGDAFQALLRLVNDGVPVDDLQRGLTNYHAQNYEPARAAFDRYLQANPQADGQALYTTGLTYADAGQDVNAIAIFRQLVEQYPRSDPYWARAYLQIAFIQPYPQDVQTFQEFVAAAPDASEAPDALFRAARLAERNADLRTAAVLWTRLALEYPTALQAADAALQAGLVLYRAGDISSAGQRFEQAAALTADPDVQARAWLWIGKVRTAQGDSAGAQAAWSRAAGLAPHDYYGYRADQLLRGLAPFDPPRRYAFDFDRAAKQAEAEAWLRACFPLLQNQTDLSELQPGLWNEARFVRGAELWRLGLLPAAHAEFDSLRRDMRGDPLAMWQLALYFNQIGAFDLAIRSARQVVDLAGLTDSLLAPRFVLRLRYPTPFTQQVSAAAADYGLHPFYLYAKMRLESFFWKYAVSSAQARGLNQIIPPTADDIARRLGLTDFTYTDLFRPAVSIPMGAFYLDFVGEYTRDDPAAILAGYYAGPGNAQAWLDLADGDPDLFVEVIRLPDAKGYVETAFEYFETYRELYATQ